MKKIKFISTTIKIFMKNQMQDKTNVILDIINMISRCLVVFLLYHYIFKINGGYINGEDYKTTMWSMFIYFALMTFKVRRIVNQIMLDVKSGNVEMYMNKPISYLTLAIFRTIGDGLYSFLFISIVGAIIMIIFVGLPSLNLSIFIPTLVITLILGQILGILIYSLIGLISFFIEDSRPIYWIVDKFVMVLGGSYLPVSMFPKFMKIMAYYSPFGLVNLATSTVFDSWNSVYLYRILILIIWIIVFYIVVIFVYKKTKEKAMINGG